MNLDYLEKWRWLLLYKILYKFPPTINYTLCSDSCHELTAVNTDSSEPELTRVTSDLLNSRSSNLTCLSTDLQAPPTLLRCRVNILIRSLLGFFCFVFFIYISLFLFLFICCRGKCVWFCCAVLEWRVRPKAVNGADSLWGNKPSHGTPQAPPPPRPRLASRSPSHTSYSQTFCTVCQIPVLSLLSFFSVRQTLFSSFMWLLSTVSMAMVAI